MGNQTGRSLHNRPVLIDGSAESSRVAASHGSGEYGSGDYGFSVLELDRAGLSESRAHALGVPIDGTRHYALLHNVRHLKNFTG